MFRFHFCKYIDVISGTSEFIFSADEFRASLSLSTCFYIVRPHPSTVICRHCEHIKANLPAAIIIIISCGIRFLSILLCHFRHILWRFGVPRALKRQAFALDSSVALTRIGLHWICRIVSVDAVRLRTNWIMWFLNCKYSVLDDGRCIDFAFVCAHAQRYPRMC